MSELKDSEQVFFKLEKKFGFENTKQLDKKEPLIVIRNISPRKTKK